MFHFVVKTISIFAIIFIFDLPVDASENNHSAKRYQILESASELDYPPFALVHMDETADGFSVELLNEVAKVAGLKIHFNVGPWHAIKQKLINGNLDVLPLVSYSKDRDKVFDFSASYLRLHGTIFVRKGDTSIQNETDLIDKEVIVMQGDNAHEYVVQNRLTNKLILTDNYEAALKLLASGKHDAVLMLQLVGFQLLEELNITNVVSIHSFKKTDLKPIDRLLSGFEQRFCFAVPEGNKALLALLNEGLAIVIASGTYNDLYDKWFGPILPQPDTNWPRIFQYLFSILLPILFLSALIGLWFLKKQVALKTRHLKNEIQVRKRAEQTLQASENKFRTLFNVAGIPLCYADDNGAILDFNAKFTQIFGYTRSDIPTLDQWWELAYPDPEYRKWAMQTWNDAVKKARKENSDIQSVEYRVTCKTGEIKNIIISGTTFQEYFLATFIDLTELKQAEERFERFFTLIPDIFCIADIDGFFRMINPAAEKILGYSQQELQSKPVMAFVHPDDRESTRKIIEKKLAQGVSILNFSNRYIAKDGSSVWLEWTSYPMVDQGITYAVARDCTARLKAEGVLKKTLDDLERSNIELKQFAYMASHDLQEPLRATVGFLQLLQSKYSHQLDEKGRHYIDRSMKAGYRMQQLINDLLAVSRINAQNTFFEQADLSEILEGTLENLQSLIHKKNAEITSATLPRLDVDKVQIQSLFQNLIGNALKYNKTEFPKIDIGFENRPDECRFSITDNGIGISPEFHEKIFLIFQRLHTRHDFSGNGIGLALCKKVVERHRGKIWVESEPEKGSTFYFTLPHNR